MIHHDLHHHALLSVNVLKVLFRFNPGSMYILVIFESLVVPCFSYFGPFNLTHCQLVEQRNLTEMFQQISKHTWNHTRSTKLHVIFKVGQTQDEWLFILFKAKSVVPDSHATLVSEKGLWKVFVGVTMRQILFTNHFKVTIWMHPRFNKRVEFRFDIRYLRVV